MIDVFATLCLLAAPETCVARVVPVGAGTCAEAEAAASGRLKAWRSDYIVRDVRCGALEGLPLDFVEVRPGLFVHRGQVGLADGVNGGDIGNIAFVVGEDAVAVIDSGGSRALGEAVIAAVRAVTDRPIRFLILTHFHPDHIFGGTALIDAGAEVLAHERLPDAMAARANGFLEQGRRQVGADFTGSEVPCVDRTIAVSESLDLGGRVLKLQAWPVAHSDSDLTVLDHSTATLIAGDLVFDRHLPTLDGSLVGWLDALDRLEALNAEQAVPGHGGPLLPWPEGLEAERRYLDTLRLDVREHLAAGDTITETVGAAAQEERGNWILFDEHNPRNATTAYTELEWE